MTYKILIADDDKDVRTIQGLFIERIFPAALTEYASDGVELLAKAMQNSYDLILSDNNMPNKNGSDALRELKTAGRLEKALVCTGIKTDEDRAALSELGIPILEKPYTFAQLTDKLKEMQVLIA